MTDISHKWELSEIAQALRDVARAIEKANKKEPVYIFLPSDAEPARVKELAEELRKVLR